MVVRGQKEDTTRESQNSKREAVTDGGKGELKGKTATHNAVNEFDVNALGIVDHQLNRACNVDLGVERLE